MPITSTAVLSLPSPIRHTVTAIVNRVRTLFQPVETDPAQRSLNESRALLRAGFHMPAVGSARMAIDQRVGDMMAKKPGRRYALQTVARIELLRSRNAITREDLIRIRSTLRTVNKVVHGLSISRPHAIALVHSMAAFLAAYPQVAK